MLHTIVSKAHGGVSSERSFCVRSHLLTPGLHLVNGIAKWSDLQVRTAYHKLLWDQLSVLVL